MAHRKVVEAVRARLTAGFDRCEITKDGDASTSGRQQPFLAVDFPHSSARQASAGSPEANVYREEGGILFRLFVPRRSIAEGRQWADEIGDLFRGKRFDGVTTSAPTSPGTDNRNDASGLYELAFVVPYRFDLRG